MANLCPFRKLLLNKLSLKKPFSAGNLMDTLNDLFALWREDYDLGVLMVAGGGMIGLLFGIFAERTDFCSRAAFARLLGGTWRQDGTSLLYLLLAMLAAITGVQGLALTDAVDFSISGGAICALAGLSLVACFSVSAWH